MTEPEIYVALNLEPYKPMQEWEIAGSEQAIETLKKRRSTRAYQAYTNDLDMADADAGEHR